MCVRITVSASIALADAAPVPCAARPAGAEEHVGGPAGEPDALLFEQHEPPCFLPRPRPTGWPDSSARRRLFHVALRPLEQRRLGDVDEADRLAEVVLVLVDLAAEHERRDVERLVSEHVLVLVDRAARDADRDRAELEEEQREQAAGVERVLVRAPAGPGLRRRADRRDRPVLRHEHVLAHDPLRAGAAQPDHVPVVDDREVGPVDEQPEETRRIAAAHHGVPMKCVAWSQPEA